MTHEEFYKSVIELLTQINNTLGDMDFTLFAAVAGEFGHYPEITNALLKGYYDPQIEGKGKK